MSTDGFSNLAVTAQELAAQQYGVPASSLILMCGPVRL